MSSRSDLILRWSLRACLCVMLAGCGGGETSTTTSSDSDNSPTSAAPPSMGTTTPTSSPATAQPLTPDGTVKAFFVAIDNNQLGAIWDLLPPSYQQDINGLVRDFGGQVDAELWDQTFSLLNRYVQVQIDKIDMALETPKAQQEFAILNSQKSGWLTKESFKSYSLPQYQIIKALVNGELSSVAKLKSFDGKSLLSGSLTSSLASARELETLLKEAAEQNPEQEVPAMVVMFDDLKTQVVSLESVNGENAVVTVKAKDELDPQPIKLTRVEGKWIPSEMASGFKPGIQQSKQFLPGTVQFLNTFKGQALPILQTLETQIAAMEQAKTQDEFNAALSTIEKVIQQQQAGLGGAIPGFDPSMLGLARSSNSQSSGSVTVIVRQELNDVQLKKLIRELEQLTDNPEEAILLPKQSGGEIAIEISPVKGFLKFSTLLNNKRLGEVIEEDSTTNTVTIRLNPDSSR